MDVLNPTRSRILNVRLLAYFLALLVLMPGVATAQQLPSPEYPDELLPLAGGWVDEARAVGAEFQDREWYAEAEGFLDEAEQAVEDGRFRVALFDLETFHELLETGRLMDEAATLGSDAERKALVASRTGAWAKDAEDAWVEFRAKLHALEADLRSLHAVERALYASDSAITARVSLTQHEMLIKEYSKQQNFQEGYVIALVGASHTPLLNLEWASEILDTVSDVEGLEPRIDLVEWNNMTRLALVVPEENSTPPHFENHEKIAVDVRENEEGLLAVGIYLAELREARKSSIYLIFGDAESRAKDVVNDSAASMRGQLANASMSDAQDFGLQGVFLADAMDRAAYTLEFVPEGRTNLGIIVSSWASLDHAMFVTSVLGGASPIQPATEEETPKETPGPTFALVLGSLLGVAALAGARGRRER